MKVEDFKALCGRSDGTGRKGKGYRSVLEEFEKLQGA